MLGARERCPACGSADHRTLSSYDAGDLARCGSCGCAFARRLPSGDELEEHYAGYPVRTEIPELTHVRYRELLAGLARFRAGGRALDVGCAAGHFVAAAAAQGWDAAGVEPAEHLREHGRASGLAVFERLDDVPAEPRFDLVTAFEVVEHMTHPADELERMAAFLRPGGAMYLTTPNFDSLSRRLLGPRWSVIDYPEHLNYFTLKSLSALLRRTGLEPAEASSTGVSLTRIDASLTRAGRERWDTGGADADQALRQRIERRALLRGAKRGANRALSALHAGDTLKLLAVRRP
jgi:SAM-dependent methyltransferase